MASDLGVYIHFPWCRKLCPYCDFAVMVAHHEPPHEAYRDAVVAELAARAAAVEGRRLRSIYLGGGTPGLWRPDCVGDVVAAVLAAAAAPGPDALEITIEVNPTDVTAARLAAWRDAGVNRVSIGVQSFDAAELAALGRDHWAGDGPRAVELALAAGLRSVSADLIAGTPAGLVAAPSSSPPSSSVAAARGAPAASIAALIATGVPHASVYELTIEPRTRFGKLARRGALVPRPDDELAALYEANHRALEAAGLEHYEISSYARPGHRAVHNSLYWSGAEYLGLGAGAASFERRADGGARRVTNLRHARRYLAAAPAARADEVVELGADEVAVDRVWLALRTRDGAALAEVAALPGAARLRARLAAEGLAEEVDGRLRPTLRGFLFNDRLARHVVDAADPAGYNRPPTS